MGKERTKYISNIERKKAARSSTKSGYRLDMAERLFDFPDRFLDSFLSEINDEDLIVYPKEDLNVELKAQLSKINDLDPKSILIDSGSDAIIKNCFHSLCNENDSIIISSPSFPMYKIYGNMFGLELIEVGFKNTFNFDIKDMLNSTQKSTKMVILANPNSPYGDFQDLNSIIEILNVLQDKKILLLLDEAYVDFGSESMAHLIKVYDNLIVLRTFSKAWGAAGSRVGYCFSNEKNIEQIEKVQLTYPVSNISLKFAIYLCKNYDVVKEYVSGTINERDLIIDKLKELNYDVLPSANNSIHLHDSSDNKKVTDIFNKHGVSFKKGSTASTPLTVPGDERNTWIRISIGHGILKTPYMKELLS